MSDTAATTTNKPSRPAKQKVPPFARYKGTSAWRKDRRRAREYARYLAATKTAA